MRYALPLLILAGAAIALMATPSETPILGLSHGAFTRASLGAAILTAFVVRGFRRARPSDIARGVSALATWALLLVALTGVYAYRFEVSDFAERVAAEFFPSEPQVGQGGEIIVNRRAGGEFVVAAKVNQAKVAFLFDTGASTIVLTGADARRAGVILEDLVFDIPVTTANGAAMAANARLAEVSVGPIVMRNLRALVARPGALSQSLLGMNFLERLQSYTVERGKLVMRAK